MRFITSFGDSGYDLYGEKFLKTFIRYWDAPLNVYYEEKRRFPKSKKINYLPLWEVPHVEEYLKRPKVQKTAKIEDYRFQVHKFSRKSFVQIDEIRKGGKVFWLDADIETSEKADIQKVLRHLKGTAICYMGREGFYPCTSFVGFDGNHELIHYFVEAYEDIYLSEEIFNIPEWHDAYVFDWVRKKVVEEHDLPTRNISRHIKRGLLSYNVFNFCFPWARHKKGQRKYKSCQKW